MDQKDQNQQGEKYSWFTIDLEIGRRVEDVMIFKIINF
jgi:hypothetical protein